MKELGYHPVTACERAFFTAFLVAQFFEMHFDHTIKRLFVGMSSRRPGFNSRIVLVEFVADSVALEQVTVRPTLHSHISFTYLQPCGIVAVESVDK